MIGFNDLQQLIADSFLNGDTNIAGIIMFIIALAAIFCLIRNLSVGLVLSLPVSFLFSQLGVISGDVMILMIIVAVIGLSLTASNVFARKG